jgi:hypothetical protein
MIRLFVPQLPPSVNITVAPVDGEDGRLIVNEPEVVSAIYCEPAVAVNVEVTLDQVGIAPVAPSAPAGPVGPVAPTSPLFGPTHSPDEFIICRQGSLSPKLTIYLLHRN